MKEMQRLRLDHYNYYTFLKTVKPQFLEPLESYYSFRFCNCGFIPLSTKAIF